MAGSHTATSAREEAAEARWLTLVPGSASGLSEQLSGRVDGHLEAFAERMGEGRLAASTAVGLELQA